MSASQLILAGTLLIFIAAVGVFIAAVVRSRRDRARFTYVPASVPGAHRGVGVQGSAPDMSLDGLDVGIAEDSHSASVLTPLRTGEWMPPEEPAPLEGLDQVSLAGRVAEYTPAPDVPEPPFSVEQYPSWQVGSDDSGSAGEVVWPVAPDVATGIAPEPGVEPAPVLEPATGPEMTEEAGDTGEFSAEIAALLPPPETEPVAVPQAEPEPMPVPQPEPEPMPVPQPEPEPMPKPQPVLEPEPAPAPAPVRAPVPAPEPPPASAPAELADDEFWGTILAEQTRAAPRAAAPAPATAPRPTIRVAEPPPPPVAAPPASHASALRARPQARVHLTEAEQAGAVPESGSRHVASAVPAGAPGVSDRAAVDPQLTMAAPIEVWFGDSRIGVKAGTATYDRFRKYADALLADVRSSGASGGAPR